MLLFSLQTSAQRTPSTILRMVPLPQEGGFAKCSGSLLRGLAAEGRLREYPCQRAFFHSPAIFSAFTATLGLPMGEPSKSRSLPTASISRRSAKKLPATVNCSTAR